MKIYFKGTTLIETIVAIIILMIVFNLAINYYLKSTENNINHERLKSFYLLRNQIVQDNINKNFNDTSYRDGNILIIKRVLPYKQSKNLFKIQYCCYKNDIILYKRTKVILNASFETIN